MLNMRGVKQIIYMLKFCDIINIITLKSVVVLASIFFSLICLDFPVVIIIVPLISSMCILLAGRYFSVNLCIFFILLSMFLVFTGSVCLLYFDNVPFHTGVINAEFCCWKCWVYFQDNGWTLNWFFDNLSISMLVLVSSVSLCVHVYSVFYMYRDPSLVRFLAYLLIFTFFMFVLSTSANFVLFFLGWEGVGLMSYLLISFWNERIQACKSAWKAVYVNRIGDFSLLVSMCLIFSVFQTFDFFDVFGQAYAQSFLVTYYVNLFYDFYWLVYEYLFDCGGYGLRGPMLHLCGLCYDNFLISGLVPFFYTELIVFLLFLAAMAKSSQVGLHAWLPDAMEGPTPVSALIHAATMVTAGVYLLLRCSPLLSLSILSQYYMAFFGGATCIYAGILACQQLDAKKLVAYSTMSQLGYMVLGCSVGYYSFSFFHLWVHGYVKSLLFLSVGVVIHSMLDEQNMLRMGGLKSFFPFVTVAVSIGSMSLMAVAPFSGFFSKEPIIELPYFYPSFGLGEFVYIFGVVGAFFTSFYSVKLLCLMFFGRVNFPVGLMRVVSKSDRRSDISAFVFVPLMCLACSSIFLGYMSVCLFSDCSESYVHCISPMSDMYGLFRVGSSCLFSVCVGFMDSINVHVLRDFLFLSELNSTPFFLPDFQWDPRILYFSPFFFVYAGTILSMSHYSYEQRYGEVPVVFIRGITMKFYFDKVTNIFFCKRALLTFYNTVFLSIDKGVLELFGPYGVVAFFLFVSRVSSRLQTGSVVVYLAVFVWASAVLVFLGTVVFFDLTWV